MGKFERGRDGGEMDERDLELRQWIADLQPWPKRNREGPSKCDGHAVTRAEAEQITRRKPALLGEDFRGAEEERREQVDVGDDAAGAGGNGKPAQETSGDRRGPRRQHA